MDGSLEIAGLISTTSPLKGAYKSSAAFTDSIVPKLCPFFTAFPIFGKSTKTMSPNAFCAKSEIPKVAVSPLSNASLDKISCLNGAFFLSTTYFNKYDFVVLNKFLFDKN